MQENLHAEIILVLPPISTYHLTVNDVDDLTRRTRDAMLNALIDVTESPLGQKSTKASVTPREQVFAYNAMMQEILERKSSTDKPRDKRQSAKGGDIRVGREKCEVKR